MNTFFKKFILLISFALLFSLFGASGISAAGIKKVNIPKPMSHPQIKDYLTTQKEGTKFNLDNGVQVYYNDVYELSAKKDGKTLWEKSDVLLLAVEGNFIFTIAWVGEPADLVVFNSQGKTVYQSKLNGTVSMGGYIRSGDMLYFVTDRLMERVNEMGTDKSRKYSRLVAVSVKTGKILWQKELGVVNSSLVMHKGRIFMNDGLEGLISFDTKGNNKILHIKGDFYGEPVFSTTGLLYLNREDEFEGVINNFLEAYDQNFRLSWKQQVNGLLSIKLTQDIIIANASNLDNETTQLVGFSNKGNKLWTYKFPGFLEQTLISGDTLFFMSYINNAKFYVLKNEVVALDGRTYALNKRTGAVQYKTELGDYTFAVANHPKKPSTTNRPFIEEKLLSDKKTYYILK